MQKRQLDGDRVETATGGAVPDPTKHPAQDPVADPAAVKALARRQDTPGLRHLTLHLGLLAVTGFFCLTAEGSVLVAALLSHGILLAFLFTPLHECIHRTAFATPWINRVVADVAGFLMVLPPRWFAAFHFAHHRFTQDPDRDPELASPKPTTFGRYLYVLSGFEYWYRAVRGLLVRALGSAADSFLDDRLRRRAIVEARVYVLLYATVGGVAAVTDPWPLLKLWIVPALLGQPFLRAYLLSEHWGCPNVRDMWINTRSTVSLAPIRWLAWNMPYHAEHHANPGIPFHALPAYARLMADRRKTVSPGYAAFHAERVTALREGRAEPL